MPATKDPKQRTAPETARPERPHPSLGGARGYDVPQREFALAIRANGDDNNPAITQLRQNRLHPSVRSCQRWVQPNNLLGHILPFEMNGNNPAHVLRGHKLLMLVMYRICFPKANAAEINAFLFGTTLPGQEYRFFSESEISKAEAWLGLSRKRASTTAYQASLPINIAKRYSFWNDPYPFGIHGCSRSSIIDWDEAGIFLETTNRGYGKCYISTRAKEEGPYNHSEKFTITAAIRGGQQGGSWIDFVLTPGTSIVDTYDFLQHIITDVGPGGIPAAGGIDNTQTFICDNLISHRSPLIHLLVSNNRHRLIFRAPYNPWDGPIEYFFNHLQQQLTMELYNIRTPQQLQLAVNQIFQRTAGEFDNYFRHCGYNTP